MTNLFDDKLNSYEITFKNIEYVITMYIEPVHENIQQQITNNEKLCLEIEDKITSERWKGVFDSTYIEDLTRKTGNFKQFLIFVNMLETALNKSSDAVSLELFTYNDLEQLKNKKSNTNSSLLTKSSNSSVNSNNNKRYLILTYNVEFDRIHYPLQLNYQGKPDPVVLQDVIRKLKNEINIYRSQPNNNDAKRNEFIKLQRDYEKVLKEKESLEFDLSECNIKLRECMQNTNETMQKEIKTLKLMIKNIEEDSLKEKSTYQKQLHKKIKENNQLIEEISELKSSERNLQHQIKVLQNELAVYRRNRVFNNSSNNGETTTRRLHSRESSRENSLTRTTRHSHTSRNSNNNSFTNNNNNNHRRDRSLSRESSLTRQIPKTSERLSSVGSGTRRSSLNERSKSRDHDFELLRAVATGIKSNRSRSNSYDRSRNNQIKRSNRVKTPSPSNSVASNGSGRRRFNPTEYVKDKNRKLGEIELKKQREINRNMNKNDKLTFNSKNFSNGKVRTPSVSSINSGLESDNDSISSFGSHSRHKSDKSRKRDYESSRNMIDNQLKQTTSSSTPNNTINPNNKNKRYINDYNINDTNDTINDCDDYNNNNDQNGKFDYYHRQNEIKEIDARLKSLQLFMKNNMPH